MALLSNHLWDSNSSCNPSAILLVQMDHGTYLLLYKWDSMMPFLIQEGYNVHSMFSSIWPHVNYHNSQKQNPLPTLLLPSV